MYSLKRMRKSRGPSIYFCTWSITIISPVLYLINGDILPPVNVEKLVVVPDDNDSNIRPDDLAIDYENMEPETARVIPPNCQNQDLQTIALHFAKYLLSCTKKTKSLRHRHASSGNRIPQHGKF